MVRNVSCYRGAPDTDLCPNPCVLIKMAYIDFRLAFAGSAYKADLSDEDQRQERQQSTHCLLYKRFGASHSHFPFLWIVFP